MKRSGQWLGWATLAVIAVAVVAAWGSSTKGKTKVRATLHATVHAPHAKGLAKLALRKGPKGTFIVKARGLSGGQSFDVVVNRVKVGTLVTGPGGSGVAKFSTSPRGHTTMLGFDPRGGEIEVRDENGDDDLDGDMSDDNPDSAIGCCVGERDDDEDEVDCERKTAAECTAEGGTPSTAPTCLPNPCATTPPPTKVVCCESSSAGGAFVDDDPEVECEDDITQTECAKRGGMVVQATSCDPNPCQPVPPPQLVICCVPDESEMECERLTSDHCTAVHGTPSSATSCDNDPCGGNGDQGNQDGDGGNGGEGGGHDD
jgi:hypothetical protein